MLLLYYTRIFSGEDRKVGVTRINYTGGEQREFDESLNISLGKKSS